MPAEAFEAFGATEQAQRGQAHPNARGQGDGRGVWVGVRPVSYRTPVMTNTTLVIGDSGVLVFDGAGLAIQGERLLNKVAELTDKPITHIAISHWHGDHSMGLYKVLEKYPDAEVIAHEFTARYIASPNMDTVQPRDLKAEADYRAKVEKALATGVRSDGTPVTPSLRAFFEDLLANYDFVNEEITRRQVTRPTRTMTDRLAIDLGGRTVELRHLARGNTKGDMLMWLPEERILATGDIVVAPTPYGFFSYPKSWAGVLRELKSFGARTIVPGHGDVMTDTAYLDLLAETMDLVAREVVEAAIEAEDRRPITIAQEGITRAQQSYDRNLARIRNAQGLPIEVLQSIQALDAVRREYLRSVMEYNRAQFRLQRALGWPVAAPVSAGGTPSN